MEYKVERVEGVERVENVEAVESPSKCHPERSTAQPDCHPSPPLHCHPERSEGSAEETFHFNLLSDSCVCRFLAALGMTVYGV